MLNQELMQKRKKQLNKFLSPVGVFTANTKNNNKASAKPRR